MKKRNAQRWLVWAIIAALTLMMLASAMDSDLQGDETPPFIQTYEASDSYQATYEARTSCNNIFAESGMMPPTGWCENPVPTYTPSPVPSFPPFIATHTPTPGPEHETMLDTIVRFANSKEFRHRR